jgi:predicted kinase
MESETAHHPAVLVIVLIGLPGAGKTSFVRAFFAHFNHVSKDHFPNARNRSARELRTMEAALLAGRSVIVDDTNTRASDRAPFVALARRYGARVLAYEIDATTRECVARNALRQGRARVPDVAIFARVSRMEPATASEGFDAIYRARLDKGGFEITPVSGGATERCCQLGIGGRK